MGGTPVFLGIGLDHDAGVVFTDHSGKVLWAAGEERFSKKKNHFGFPYRALTMALRDLRLENETSSITDVILGTYGRMTPSRAKCIITTIESRAFPISNFGKNTDIDPPGLSPGDFYFEDSNNKDEDPATIERKIKNYLHDFLKSKFNIDANISLVVHHDSHAASGFFASGFERALVLSFDGQGDGESGIIGLADRSCPALFEHQVRIPYRDSLGHLYGATTNRYGMKSNRHEGKILGLAAFGKPSKAVEQIRRLITIKDGVPYVNIPFSKEFNDARGAVELQSFRHTDFLELYFKLIETREFPDLAYAVQKVLEDTMLQIAQYWCQKFQIKNLALTGGVFANVKVNQLLAESLFPAKIYIYPNMGDGGLPAGAVWYWMHSQGRKVEQDPQPLMYSGPNPDFPSGEDLLGVTQLELPSIDEASKLIARLISKQFYCGIVEGRMEFGPRALGHRTILADPRSRTVNQDLNARLQRTEYMPFAPICLPEAFDQLFEVSKHASIVPFYHMTMLCKVKKEWIDKIPAVVHVDHTARPQYLIKEENEFLYQIMKAFRELTGIPCLVNTSFNVHEEPIIFGMSDALRSLRSMACDCVIFDGNLYYLSGNKKLERELV